MTARALNLDDRWNRLHPGLRAAVLDVGAALLWGGFTAWASHHTAADLLWSLASAALLLVRRRAPLLSLAGTAAIAAFVPLDGSLTVCCAAYTVGTRSRPLVGLLATLTVSGVFFFASTWVIPDLFTRIMAASFFVLLPALMGLYVRRTKQMGDVHRERASALAREQQLVAERAVSEERNRIAQEMHDLLGHKLSLMVLHAGALEYADGPHSATARLIGSTGRDAMRDLRRIIGLFGVGPPAAGSATESGLAALEQLVEASRSAGVPVTAMLDRRFDELELMLRRVTHRVVQESLTNIHKHAGGVRTMVKVAVEDDVVRVDVRNDRPQVVPVTTGTGSQRGLLGLAQRVELARGRLEHGATADGGFRVLVTLPLSCPETP